MKNFKRIILILIFISIPILTFNFFYFNMNNNTNQHDITLLERNIITYSTEYSTISLNQITPFKWEKVYFFPPYTSKSEIFKTIGFRCGGIFETHNEGMMQIIFTNKNKVVCNISGYNSKFYINSSKHLLSKDDPQFIVTKTGEKKHKLALNWYNSDLLPKNIQKDTLVANNKIGTWKYENKTIYKERLIEELNEFVLSKDGIVVGYTLYREVDRNTQNFISQKLNSYVGYINGDLIKYITEKGNEKHEIVFDGSIFSERLKSSNNRFYFKKSY